jgi:hypothetical protein
MYHVLAKSLQISRADMDITVQRSARFTNFFLKKTERRNAASHISKPVLSMASFSLQKDNSESEVNLSSSKNRNKQHGFS